MSPATTLPESNPAPLLGRGWWNDLPWLLFLAALAILPPVGEPHKQLILLALALVQLFETRVLARWPRWGPAAAVAAKILLAWLLLAHTGDLTAINSRYYPIFFVPVITAAMFYGRLGTLGWTAFASAAYCSYLWPALRQYRLDQAAVTELAIRVVFFFLAALIVNRIVLETRRQRDLYRQTAESLEATNRQLRLVQAEARRSERLAALGQLSAGLAHEIRNPLGVIKGSAEMLEKTLGTANPVAVELAGYISSEVNRVNALVTRFLDFARPASLQLRPTPLGPVLERALHEAQVQHPAATVRVHYTLVAGLAPVPMDEALCERVFSNLAANAYDAMEAMPEAGELRVTAEPATHGGRDGVEITFADNGPGVAAEMREQIFNPFVTTKPTGVGLGLAIVAKIVDQHGGELRLLPTEGHGATFQVFLPWDHTA